MISFTTSIFQVWRISISPMMKLMKISSRRTWKTVSSQNIMAGHLLMWDSEDRVRVKVGLDEYCSQEGRV